MDSRKIIDERIILNIPVNSIRSYDYKPGILWEELIRIEGVLPSDVIKEVGYRKEKESGFGSMREELEDIYIPTLVVVRKRPETDDEFLKRKREDEAYNKQQEEKEKLEYLRLKAKFETL